MSQRRKIRREFVERDGLGNITTLSDDVAVWVMKNGCEFKTGGALGGASISLEVYHPGRVDANSQGYIVGSDGEAKAGIARVTSRTQNASGVWVLGVQLASGAITVAAGDRFVHAPNLGSNRQATLYTSDTNNSLFGASRFTDGSSTDPPTGALIADANGVIEFYTDETDIDMIVVQASDPTGTIYGFITDVFTGRKEGIIDPIDWGAEPNTVSDSWPAIKAAIEYAEDERDRKVVVHIPGGEYKISGPLEIDGDNIEIWMDKDTVISAHSSWASTGRGLFEINGNGCVIRGGQLVPEASDTGVRVLSADDAVLDGVEVTGGFFGFNIASASRAVVRGCRLLNQATSGIYCTDCNYSYIDGNYFEESGGASAGAVHILAAGAAITELNTVSNNVFLATPGTSTGRAIEFVAQSSSPNACRSNKAVGNSVTGYGGGGIRLRYGASQVVEANTIRDIGGTNSGARDNKEGIELLSSDNALVIGNSVSTCNGSGLKIHSATGAGPFCARCVVANNSLHTNAEEGLDAAYLTTSVVQGNNIQNNSTGAASTFDAVLAATVLSITLVSNVFGTDGLDISATATVEIGHNLEL